jgi:hypothetical protein
MAHLQTCEELWELLSAYADGMTTPDEAGRVERHAAICPECARDLRFMRETAHVLADAPEVVPPATLRDSILAATIYRPTWQQRIREAARRLVPTSPLRAMAWAGSAAAIVLVAWAASSRTGQLPAVGGGTDVASAPSPSSVARPLPFSAAPGPKIARITPSVITNAHPKSDSTSPGDSVDLPDDIDMAPPAAAPRIVQASQAKGVSREDSTLRRRAELALLSRADSAARGFGRRSANRNNVAALRPHVNELTPDLQPERVEQPREMLTAPSIDTADMKIPMTAMNTDPMTAAHDATTGPMTTPSAAAQPAERSHVTLAGFTGAETSAPSSVLTLADLRRQLRRQNNESSLAMHPELRLRTRRDTLDVVKSSF